MFRKIFLTYLSILILIMAVLSVTVSSLASNYVYGEKKKTLESVESRVNEAANEYSSGSLDQAGLTEVINSLAYITDTKIYVLSGNVPGNIDLGGELSGDYLKDAIGNVLKGQSVFTTRQYSSDFDAQMIFAACPWQDSGTIKGAILLFSPEKEVASIISNVQLAIGLTAAGFVVIGAVIIFLFSRRIVRPVKAIEAASQKVADGEYPEDIRITTKDELGNLARSFNVMKDKLLRNENLRQDLIANISHDLRTPLTNINGFLSGMSDGVIKPEDYPKYLGILRSETKRLISLTGSILETAKIQSSSIELTKETFSLKKVVNEAADANSALSMKKKISVVIQIPAELTLYADKVKIGLVINNLINNAIKYTDNGGKVSIEAHRGDKGAEITVADNGIGIPEKDLAAIFDRFYRAENSSESGYGLGLSIAKAYIEAHGGSISIKSAQGEGTKITFNIP